MFSKKKTEDDVIAFKHMNGAAAKKRINCLLCQGRVEVGLNFCKECSDYNNQPAVPVCIWCDTQLSGCCRQHQVME